MSDWPSYERLPILTRRTPRPWRLRRRRRRTRCSRQPVQQGRQQQDHVGIAQVGVYVRRAAFPGGGEQGAGAGEHARPPDTLSRTPDLAEHPEAEIELNGRKVAVTAAQLSGDVREAASECQSPPSPASAVASSKNGPNLSSDTLPGIRRQHAGQRGR